MDFDSVEDFDCHDSAGIYRKISVLLKEAVDRNCGSYSPYSKGTDTAALLLLIDPEVICNKNCPYFRTFWQQMQKLLT